MSEEEFLDALAVEFVEEIDRAELVPEAGLVRDLDLDSLQLIRLAAFVESLAPIELPDDLDPGDATLADVFYYYETITERAASAAVPDLMS
jgi:acyl carrier protein